MSEIVGSVVKGVFKVAKFIYDRAQAANANSRRSKKILENVRDLEKFADQLKKVDREGGISGLVEEELRKVNDALQVIEVQCRGIAQKGTVTKMIDVSSDMQDLEILADNLQRARDCFNFALSLATFSQTTKITEDLRQGNQEIKNTIHHPNAGIYMQPHSSRPNRINKFTISPTPEGDLVELLWTGDDNDQVTIDRYELLFDDETSKIIPIPINEVACRNNIYSILLGNPQINSGETYTLKIRAVNGSGPGSWSNSTTFVFKSGPPSKPKKPKVSVKSPTAVVVEVKKLSQKEERGSAVTGCKVEYMKIEQMNEIERYWQSLNITLKSKATDVHKFVIGQLQPHTQYKFRVKMTNSSGDGEPSETCEVTTDCSIPGPPQDVRISSKRLPEILKVRWKPPSENPEGVAQYQIQFRFKDKAEWMTSARRDSSARSHKVTGLKTDTKYQFQVLALNHNDEGNASHSALGETRYGTFGQVAGSIAAGVGGTIGAPLVGGVGAGALAAQTAKSVPDSETGKTAAAVAAGAGAGVVAGAVCILAAPVVGICAGIMANQKLKGNMDDTSPQTSDDENESNESFFQRIAKQSQQNTSTMFSKD